MRVADLARGSVAVLEADDTLADAAREMEDNGIAAVCVYEGGTLIGIITERDLVRAAAEGAPLDRTPIEEYMTASPTTLPGSADAREALRLMLEGGFRHLPVLDDDQDVVGVLTMREVVRALVEAHGLLQAQSARA